jgi:hypothetical protein
MMFPKSVEYNEKNLQFADELLSKFGADMGGTEIFEPL